VGIGFYPYRYPAYGVRPQRRVDNTKQNIFNYNNVQTSDTFVSNSPAKLLTENAIRELVSKNPEIKKILNENHIPLVLNMKELEELSQGHAKETQILCGEIAKNLTPALRSEVNLKNLKDAALLHDIGKVFIPKEILNKTGELTPQEHKIMALHSELGYQLLKAANMNPEVLNLVRNHHNLNNGADVNLAVLNIADQYSALLEKRPYKDAFSPKKALTILHKKAVNREIHPAIFNSLVRTAAERESRQKTLTNLNNI